MFVSTQEMFSFLPITIPGTPGSDTPAASHSGLLITTAYHVPGAL